MRFVKASTIEWEWSIIPWGRSCRYCRGGRKKTIKVAQTVTMRTSQTKQLNQKTSDDKSSSKKMFYLLDKLSVEKGNVRSGASGEDGAAINTDPRSQTHPRAPTARRTHLSPIPGPGDLLPTRPTAAGPQCTWGPNEGLAGVWRLKCIQGGRGWRAFDERKIIPESFRRACICKFLRQKRTFFKT